MTLTPASGGCAQGANDERSLAAGEEPPLAIQHTNGLLYNENGGGAIPHTEMKKPKRGWLQAATDWRMIIATLAAPAFCAGLIWIWPTTKNDLNIVRMESSSALRVETTAITGQIRETKADLNGKIDVLAARVDARIDGIEKSQNRLQNGVDELLRRSSPPVLTAATAPIGNPPQDISPDKIYLPQKLHKVVKKKPLQPVAAKPNSGFHLW